MNLLHNHNEKHKPKMVMPLCVPYEGDWPEEYLIRCNIAKLEEDLKPLFLRQLREDTMKQFREVRYTRNSISMRNNLISRLQGKLSEIRQIKYALSLVASYTETSKFNTEFVKTLSKNLLHNHIAPEDPGALILHDDGVNSDNVEDFDFTSVSEFVETSTDKWWDSLDSKKKAEYVKKHPYSKYAIHHKKHFVKLVTKYNDHSEKEHNHYMKRGTKKAAVGMRTHDKHMTETNKEFVKHFGHYIPKKDRKDFNLGHYNTKNPHGMVKEWIK